MNFFLVFLLIVKRLTSAEVMSVGHDKDSTFVRNLIIDYNNKEPAMKDVVLFKFNEYSKWNVDDAYESVRKAIPTENPVLTPKMDRITDCRLPEVAFIIIVTDTAESVSKIKSILMKHFN
jgi:hypothetical protein